MKNKFFGVFFMIFMAVFSATVVMAQETEQSSTMTLSWWNRGWNNFSLDIQKIFGGFFLLEFERGGPAEKLLLGIPLRKNSGNEKFPCGIIATGPFEAFEGQKVNVFLIWKQNYGRGLGNIEAVPVQLQLPILPPDLTSWPYHFKIEFPAEICREPFLETNGNLGDPFLPQRLLTETMVIKKRPSCDETCSNWTGRQGPVNDPNAHVGRREICRLNDCSLSSVDIWFCNKGFQEVGGKCLIW